VLDCEVCGSWGHFELIQNLAAVTVSRHRLNLDKRVVRAKMDRYVAAGEPHVGKQRAEPTICLNNPLENGDAASLREVRRRSYQQMPVGGGLRNQSRPQLHSAWFW
jgi:hypothetical protein